MATRDDTGDLLGKADQALDKADALLTRHRTARLQPEPPPDYPVLTDVVSQSPAVTPPAPPAPEVDIAALERELRLALLHQLEHELERMVEARVHGRVSAKVAQIVERAGAELEQEVRRA